MVSLPNASARPTVARALAMSTILGVNGALFSIRVATTAGGAD